MTTPSRIRYRLRISIIGSEPEIWRTLELDGSLRLDELHDVIQIAMGWRDSHLHEFMELNPFEPRHPLPRIGRDPLRWTMPDFDDDRPGLPESEWTIAAAFAELAGPLYYEYDFGDGWTHAVELIEAEPGGDDEPRAVLLRGERRGPLEDSGGIGGYAAKVEALANPTDPEHHDMKTWVADTLGPWEDFDPAAVDADQVNRELSIRFDAVQDAVASGPLAAVFERLPAPFQREFRGYLQRSGVLDPPAIDAETAAEMVRPFVWLIRRVGAEGLKLTQAGWLPPTVVSDAVRELGWEDRWIGKMNREDQTMPIMTLRANAQRLGLLRKLKGRLVLTATAKRLLDDPIALWRHLAGGVASRQRIEATLHATLLLAVEVASGRHQTIGDYLQPIAFGLDVLGWARPDGMPLDSIDVHHVIRDSRGVFEALGVFELHKWSTGGATAGGREFARAVLQA